MLFPVEGGGVRPMIGQDCVLLLRLPGEKKMRLDKDIQRAKRSKGDCGHPAGGLSSMVQTSYVDMQRMTC